MLSARSELFYSVSPAGSVVLPMYPCMFILWEAVLILAVCPLSLLLIQCPSLVASAAGIPGKARRVPQPMSIAVAPMEPCCFVLHENLIRRMLVCCMLCSAKDILAD